MSFDIHLLGFVDGGAARGDDAPVLAALEPFVEDRGPGRLVVATADGRAEVYASNPGSGLMFTHASGRAVWDLIYDVAVAGAFVVIPGGLATCVLDAGAIADLPQGLPTPVVVTSGEEILNLVERS